MANDTYRLRYYVGNGRGRTKQTFKGEAKAVAQAESMLAEYSEVDFIELMCDGIVTGTVNRTNGHVKHGFNLMIQMG